MSIFRVEQLASAIQSTRCVRKQMRRATKLKNGTNYGDYVETKYMENPFLHIKASQS
jgi:hypothetical protein